MGSLDLQRSDAHWGHEPARDVAQASSPASSPGVPPGVRAGSGTLPQLAAGTDCATRFMEREMAREDLLRLEPLTPTGDPITA